VEKNSMRTEIEEKNGLMQEALVKKNTKSGKHYSIPSF
jgi:hypothetical protein